MNQKEMKRQLELNKLHGKDCDCDECMDLASLHILHHERTPDRKCLLCDTKEYDYRVK
jgi:hypothetical protein